MSRPRIEPALPCSSGPRPAVCTHYCSACKSRIIVGGNIIRLIRLADTLFAYERHPFGNAGSDGMIIKWIIKELGPCVVTGE